MTKPQTSDPGKKMRRVRPPDGGSLGKLAETVLDLRSEALERALRDEAGTGATEFSVVRLNARGGVAVRAGETERP